MVSSGEPLEDPGFDFTVLSEFRARLVAGSMQTEALDVPLVALVRLGLVNSGGRQRTDFIPCWGGRAA